MAGNPLERSSLGRKMAVAGFPGGYAIRSDVSARISGHMLDTFEGHLRRSGKVLIQLPEKVVLIDLVTGVPQEQACSPGWAFAEKLQGGTVGFQLLELSRLRAFSAVCDIVAEQSDVAVLDELEKTVARARATVLARAGRHATWLATVPLRGYAAGYRLFAGAIAENGFKPFNGNVDYFPMLGIDREPYASKPEMALEGRVPVYDGACQIAQVFLAVARRNESGIVLDLDTEFLHDFRVSLRRVRSLLCLLRDAYGREDCTRAKDELAGIMARTNRLRDLDVYLLGRASFFKLVPESMCKGLDVLFGVFARERQEALGAVCDFLQGSEYRQRMDDMECRFKDPGGMGRGASADEPTVHFACRMILKRYGKVARIARSINSDTPDATVHLLRIQCKKLRYLMEFFMPLFPQKKIKALVKSLKGLQDVLGRFNDCCVQRDSLAAFAAEHPMRGAKGIMLAESVGALVATLYQMQLRARVETDACLGRFANEETNRDFKQLFSVGGSE